MAKLERSWEDGTIHPTVCWEIDHTDMELHARCFETGRGIEARSYKQMKKHALISAGQDA